MRCAIKPSEPFLALFCCQTAVNDAKHLSPHTHTHNRSIRLLCKGVFVLPPRHCPSSPRALNKQGMLTHEFCGLSKKRKQIFAFSLLSLRKFGIGDAKYNEIQSMTKLCGFSVVAFRVASGLLRHLLKRLLTDPRRGRVNAGQSSHCLRIAETRQ